MLRIGLFFVMTSFIASCVSQTHGTYISPVMWKTLKVGKSTEIQVLESLGHPTTTNDMEVNPGVGAWKKCGDKGEKITTHVYTYSQSKATSAVVYTQGSGQSVVTTLRFNRKGILCMKNRVRI